MEKKSDRSNIVSLQSRRAAMPLRGSADVQKPAFASMSNEEKLALLRYTDERIVLYVEDLEERVTAMENRFIHLLRLLRSDGIPFTESALSGATGSSAAL